MSSLLEAVPADALILHKVLVLASSWPDTSFDKWYRLYNRFRQKPAGDRAETYLFFFDALLGMAQSKRASPVSSRFRSGQMVKAERKERMGHNPAVGKEMKVDAKRL